MRNNDTFILVKCFGRPQASSALFFKYNTQLGPPYHILVDTNFINFSIKNKLDIVQSMMDCLYAKCKLQGDGDHMYSLGHGCDKFEYLHCYMYMYIVEFTGYYLFVTRIIWHIVTLFQYNWYTESWNLKKVWWVGEWGLWNTYITTPIFNLRVKSEFCTIL